MPRFIPRDTAEIGFRPPKTRSWLEALNDGGNQTKTGKEVMSEILLTAYSGCRVAFWRLVIEFVLVHVRTPVFEIACCLGDYSSRSRFRSLSCSAAGCSMPPKRKSDSDDPYAKRSKAAVRSTLDLVRPASSQHPGAIPRLHVAVKTFRMRD